MLRVLVPVVPWLSVPPSTSEVVSGEGQHRVLTKTAPITMKRICCLELRVYSVKRKRGRGGSGYGAMC